MYENAISGGALAGNNLVEMAWFDLISLHVDPLRHFPVVVVHLIRHPIFLPPSPLPYRQPISQQLH